MVLLYADVVNMWGWFLIEGPTPNSGCPHDPQRKPMKLRLLSKHSQNLLEGSWRLFSCFLYSSNIGDLLLLGCSSCYTSPHQKSNQCVMQPHGCALWIPILQPHRFTLTQGLKLITGHHPYVLSLPSPSAPRLQDRR